MNQQSVAGATRSAAHTEDDGIVRRRWLAAVGPALGFALLVAVGFVLHRELAGHRLHDVFAEVRAIPPASVHLAMLLAAASYWLLSFYDTLALRYVGRTISYRRILFTSFISYAFGHNIGMATLTGGAIRYRMYAVAGLSATEVATVAGFCTLTSSIGLVALIAAALLVEPGRLSHVLHLGNGLVFGAGLLAAAALAGYAAWGVLRRRPVSLWGWTLDPPGPRIVLPQVVLGIVDVGLAAAVLWALLPGSAALSLAAFAGVYALAMTAGLVSHVPGGLGVFESVMLAALPQVPTDQLLGALLVYRTVYYLLPLLLAALLFAYREFATQRGRLSQVESWAAAWIAPVIPQVAGSLVLVAGLVLLVSGATPAVDSRLEVLRRFLPLPALELSHLAGSMAGVGLVILARALFHRVRAAYHVVTWLLAIGIAASLLRGLDFEEASLLAVVASVVWLGRRSFYRPSSVIRERFTPAWSITLVAFVAISAWVGFLAYRNVAYSSELWWTFAFDDSAPRMLRALLATSLLAAGFLLTNLLAAPRAAAAPATQEELERARHIVATSARSLANAAFTGDKRLLFSESGDAFIMYRAAGRSWVALGDPVGAVESQAETAWRFYEQADREGARIVFYQAGAQCLPTYIDLGLTALKIGEEARVPLGDFSLEADTSAELREAHRRAERDGASFELLPAGDVPPLLEALRRVSDQWLAEHGTAERRFAGGHFSEDYLSRFPIALVHAEGRVAGFANVWASGGFEELSVDLMRFANDAPRGAMDFLLTELMLWGRRQGYAWFTLGMAPLAGLSSHPLAPAWNQIGNLVFRHGEHFHDFEGLRRYKSKFQPAWEPRYLVAPGGLALPRILADISLLVSGGERPAAWPAAGSASRLA